MADKEKIEPNIKLWLQANDRTIGGEGRMSILQAIEEQGSLNKAAEKLGMSYRHLWGVIRKLENRLGFKLIESEKGGSGGGGSKLTEQGLKLVNKYNWMNETLNKAVNEKTFWGYLSTKLSARNRLKGIVKNVELGEVGAKIRIKINPAEITAFITREAVEELELKDDDEVEAVIKATEVMVSKP